MKPNADIMLFDFIGCGRVKVGCEGRAARKGDEVKGKQGPLKTIKKFRLLQCASKFILLLRVIASKLHMSLHVQLHDTHILQ